MRPPRHELSKALGLTRAEEHAIMARVRERQVAPLGGWNRLTLVVVLLILLVIGLEWLVNRVAGHFGWSLPGFAAGLVAAGLISAAFLGVVARATERGFIRELARLGHPICSRCGYHRRDMPEGQPCPECGQASRARIDEPAP